MRLLVLLGLLALPLANAVSVEPGPDAAAALAGAGYAVLDGQAYLVGGFTVDDQGRRVTQSSVYRLDPATGTLRTIAQLPQPLAHATVAAIQGKLAVFGGAIGQEATATTDAILLVDVATGTVAQHATKLAAPLMDVAVVTRGDAAILLGGLRLPVAGTDPWHRGVYRFSLEQGPTKILDLTGGRSGAAAIDTPDGILLMGGQGTPALGDCPDAACILQETLIVKTDTREVLPGPTLPWPTRWAPAVSEGRGALILGGCGNTCGPGEARDAIVRVTTTAATELPIHLQQPRGRSAAFALGPAVLLFGGVTGRFSGGTVVEPGVGRTEWVQPGPTPPWAPTGLHARVLQNQVTLTWAAPAYDGDDGPLRYELLRGETPATLAAVATVGTARAEDTIPGARAWYAVRAIGASSGEGPASAPVEAVAGDPPGPVRSLTARSGNQRIALQWLPPAGADATGYVVRCSQCPPAYREVRIDATTLTLTAPGLTNGVHYTFTVTAQNAVGEGPPEIVQAVPRDAPEPPTGLAATIQDAVAVLTWDPVAGAVRYGVHRGPAPDRLEPVLETAETRAEIPVPPGARFYVAVSAATATALGDPSAAIPVANAVAPQRPRDGWALWTDAGLRLGWSAPENDGGAPVEDYVVRWLHEGRARELARTPATTWTHADGGPAATYLVSARNAAGEGEPLEITHAPPTAAAENPRAGVRVAPTAPRVGEAVTVDLTPSFAPRGLNAYRVDFGDGTGTGWITATRVEHAYAAAGSYTITIHVRDVAGVLSEPVERTVVVGGDEAPPPDEGRDTPVAAPWLAVFLAGAAARRRLRRCSPCASE